MFWACAISAVIGAILGCGCCAFIFAARSTAIGTLNVVHWDDRNDDLLLQLDEDTSNLTDGQYITLYVKCTRR